MFWRTGRLGPADDVGYVFAFEDRGPEVGATLHHPHGEISTPSSRRMLRETANQKAFWEKHGRGLLSVHSEADRGRAPRLCSRGAKRWRMSPPARATRMRSGSCFRPVAFLAFMTAEERVDLARALKIVLLKLDGLWNEPMPLLMTPHQAPTDGQPHPEAHPDLPRAANGEPAPVSRERRDSRGDRFADFLPEDKAAATGRQG